MDIKQRLHDLVDGLNLESEITTLKPISLRMNGFEYNPKSELDIVHGILEKYQTQKELTLHDKLTMYGFKPQFVDNSVVSFYTKDNISVEIYSDIYQLKNFAVAPISTLYGIISNHDELFADIEFLEKRK